MNKRHASVIACIFQAVGISALFSWYDMTPSTIQSLLDNVLAICQESQYSPELGCPPQSYGGNWTGRTVANNSSWGALHCGLVCEINEFWFWEMYTHMYICTHMPAFVHMLTHTPSTSWHTWVYPSMLARSKEARITSTVSKFFHVSHVGSNWYSDIKIGSHTSLSPSHAACVWSGFS